MIIATANVVVFLFPSLSSQFHFPCQVPRKVWERCAKIALKLQLRLLMPLQFDEGTVELLATPARPGRASTPPSHEAAHQSHPVYPLCAPIVPSSSPHHRKHVHIHHQFLRDHHCLRVRPSHWHWTMDACAALKAQF